ncbi:MAG: hypothetical protein JSV86_06080, partial [Gemmatimonadota bacterium]
NALGLLQLASGREQDELARMFQAEQARLNRGFQGRLDPYERELLQARSAQARASAEGGGLTAADRRRAMVDNRNFAMRVRDYGMIKHYMDQQGVLPEQLGADVYSMATQLDPEWYRFAFGPVVAGRSPMQFEAQIVENRYGGKVPDADKQKVRREALMEYYRYVDTMHESMARAMWEKNGYAGKPSDYLDSARVLVPDPYSEDRSGALPPPNEGASTRPPVPSTLTPGEAAKPRQRAPFSAGSPRAGRPYIDRPPTEEEDRALRPNVPPTTRAEGGMMRNAPDWEAWTRETDTDKLETLIPRTGPTGLEAFLRMFGIGAPEPAPPPPPPAGQPQGLAPVPVPGPGASLLPAPAPTPGQPQPQGQPMPMPAPAPAPTGPQVSPLPAITPGGEPEPAPSPREVELRRRAPRDPEAVKIIDAYQRWKYGALQRGMDARATTFDQWEMIGRPGYSAPRQTGMGDSQLDAAAERMLATLPEVTRRALAQGSPRDVTGRVIASGGGMQLPQPGVLSRLISMDQDAQAELGMDLNTMIQALNDIGGGRYERAKRRMADRRR